MWRLRVLLFLLLGGFTSAFGQANSTAQQKDTSQLKLRAVLPVVYYTPETKLGGGVAAFNYFKLRRQRRNDTLSRISNARLLLLYTQTRQTTINASTDVYLLQDRLRLTGGLAFFKLPFNFYGIGNETTESEVEEFTVQYPRAQLNAKWLLRPALYGGIGYLFEHDRLVKVQEGGLLSQGHIPGSQGGRLSGPALLLTYDSRDHNFAPLKGQYLDVSYFTFGKALGSDYRYNVLEIEGRKYYHMGKNHVLAFQALYTTISGRAPFRRMALLGSSSIMRGYYSGRYRDQNFLGAQTEYRFPIWRFLAGAVFGGAGDVAHTTRRFDLFEFKPSYGAGLRFIIDPKNRIMGRFDVAFGKQSHGLYFSVGQAF